MKKFITTILALSVVSALSLTAFAADTEINQDSADKTGSTTVTYTVDPVYNVTIPQTVALGETETISVNNVVVEDGKQVTVRLTSTSEADNTFKVKTGKGAALTYGITKDSNPIAIGDVILSVKPSTGDSGSAALDFSAPTGAQYSGTYTGTITFTVSVDDAN